MTIKPLDLLEKDIDFVLGLAGIAFAQRPSGNRTYLNSFDKGISLVVGVEQLVETVQLFGRSGQFEFAAFEGVLPFELDFELSRASVREKMGDPVEVYEPRNIPGLGLSQPAELYRRDAYLVHVEFAPAESAIALVSLSRAVVK